jgi:signal transduction histidine kinase
MSLKHIEYTGIVIASAGTLINLFLMILIVGYRRPRAFERILFFLALATFLFYGGFLLLMNAKIYYTQVPDITTAASLFLMGLGLAAFPGLLIHAHISFGQSEGYWQERVWQTIVKVGGYLITAPFLLVVVYLLLGKSRSPELIASFATTLGAIWVTAICASFLTCVGFQWVFASKGSQNVSPGSNLARGKHLYQFLAGCFLFAGLTLLATVVLRQAPDAIENVLALIVLIAGVLPGAGLVYAIVRFNFLGISAQRNLVYAVAGAFLGLLYLGVVRRVSVWLEPVMPPEATAAILLFVLVLFFEPLQRVANKLLRKAFREQVDRVQRLGPGLQQAAQSGDLEKLLSVAEEQIRGEFGLEKVRIRLKGTGVAESDTSGAVNSRPGWAGQPVRLPLGKPTKWDKSGAEIGELEIVPVGSALSGETRAALEILAEQLPAIVELCRTIEQKLTLEREFAERERMALVGQMTASISHNLKNPLGSMKTVLQVQLENKELPAQTQKDLGIVLAELDRLSNKLTQLLRYARPTVRSGSAPQLVEVGAVAEQAVALLRLEAEQRGGKLELSDESGGAKVQGSEEGVTDIVSNLVVNALEAARESGAISVRLFREGPELVIEVTDDGPGISLENHARLFQPFFTTKPRGTGLGLAIVERRATELDGTVTCESPAANARGARFIVRLPVSQGR